GAIMSDHSPSSPDAADAESLVQSYQGMPSRRTIRVSERCTVIGRGQPMAYADTDVTGETEEVGPFDH
ncbi:MAG: hypothetical protein H7338_01055, partial [Candidatus Sericytochromatia bacterium]|nr:hypothetical protein [Candidatus Sericytochromatia bacterium]